MVLVVKNIPIEGPGLLGEFLSDTDLPLDICELQEGDKLPKTLNGFSAIIVLGGPMNVYEAAKYPFLDEEIALLRLALKKSLPTLGICLGAQLLAVSAGAGVGKSLSPEIGWRQIDLTPDGISDPIFKDVPHSLNVFQWHEDAFELPENSRHLAQSQVCPNQAFRVGRCAWGFQFHFETKRADIARWADAYLDSDDAGAIRKKEELLLGHDHYEEEYYAFSRQICQNFKELIH